MLCLGTCKGFPLAVFLCPRLLHIFGIVHTVAVLGLEWNPAYEVFRYPVFTFVRFSFPIILTV